MRERPRGFQERRQMQPRRAPGFSWSYNEPSYERENALRHCEMEVPMRHRLLVPSAILAALIVAALFPVSILGQKKTWTPPRTAWGEPDLQGKWSYATITPLERPANQVGKETLTDGEVAALNEDARTSADRRDGGAEADLARAYNAHWYDRGKSVGRTSLIVDPADGRLPLTAEGRARQAARAAEQAGHEYDSWENRPLPERC